MFIPRRALESSTQVVNTLIYYLFPSLANHGQYALVHTSYQEGRQLLLYYLNFYPYKSEQTHSVRLRSRLYSTHLGRALQVLVPTQCIFPAKQPGPRYPVAEGVLANSTIQPYIHDCIVNVTEGKQIHRFRVFYKRHSRLRNNRSLPHIAGLQAFRGDIVVMRVGALHELSVVNMRGHDARISDWMICRFVQVVVLTFF